MSTAQGLTLAPLRPSFHCGSAVADGVEFFPDANRVGVAGPGFVAGVGGDSGSFRNRKIVLFEGTRDDTDDVFGFGINTDTLRYQIDSTGAFNRWYARTGACASQGIFSVSGQAVVTVDPAALNTTGHVSAPGSLRFGAEGSNTGIASKRTATGNQEGLNFFSGFRGGGFGTPITFSIGGHAATGGVSRFNYNGADASASPSWSGWGATGTAQLTVDNTGTPGNDQHPMVASTYANCGSPCGQFLPPVWAVANGNASGAGLANHGGYIGWFNPARTVMYGTIGGDQVGTMDFTATVQARLIANGNLRLVAKSNVVNLPGLLVFASDAAAGTGGLVAGDVYRDTLGVLHAKL